MAKTERVSFVIICGVFILAAGAVLSALLLSRFAVSVKKSHVPLSNITVKGVAEKEVMADVGVLNCTVSCKARDIVSGYAEINRINQLLEKKFLELGIKSEWLENESVDYDRIVKTIRSKTGNTETVKEEFQHYLFSRSYRIRSSDVKKIEEASLKLYSLVANGIDIYVSPAKYFISNPEQYKIELVDDATASAYQRANIVASKCGSKLGKLLNARQGVIQITKPASNDTSDYGTYDTSTIKKVMRLVMTLDIALL